MADAHFLYVTMGVVLAGLAIWVIAVNLFAPKQPALPPSPGPAQGRGSDASGAT